MADYYPLIARAVTGLDKSTGEARRALYERARTALVTQLRGVQPALTEADITRERLALEEAIRKVEAEAARRPRPEGPKLPRANLAPIEPGSAKPASFAAPQSPPPPPPSAEVSSAETPQLAVRSAETSPPAHWDELRGEADAAAPPLPPESREAPERETAPREWNELRGEADAPASPPPLESREAPDRAKAPPDWDELRKELDNLAGSPQPESREAPEGATAFPHWDQLRGEVGGPATPPRPESREAPTRETAPPDWDQLRGELGAPAPAQRPESREAPEGATAPPDWEKLLGELGGPAPVPPPAPGAEEPSPPFRPHARPDRVAPPAPTPESAGVSRESSGPSPNARFSGLRASLVDEGLKGFRDVVAHRDDRAEGTAQAGRPAPEERDSGPPPSNKMVRREPRFRPENLTPSEQGLPPSSRPAGPRAGLDGRPVPPHPDPRAALGAPPSRPHFDPEEAFDEPDEQPLRPRAGGAARKIIALAVVVLLAAAAFFAYFEWSGSTPPVIAGRSPATQASKEAPQERPKISDRIGGAQQDSAARGARDPGAAVAQRAVLYEQQADPQERKQYVGSVIWRTETTSAGPGQPADVAIKAEVEIPERHIRLNFTVRRNLDESLPASHTVEILFSTPSDFQPGGIADVPAVLLEDNEQRSGAALTGLRVKVANGFFLVGLSSVEHELRRNVQLLKERPWLHIRLAYNNGQRAVLAIEKGVPGDRVFEEALSAWGQSPPQPSR